MKRRDKRAWKQILINVAVSLAATGLTLTYQGAPVPAAACFAIAGMAGAVVWLI